MGGWQLVRTAGSNETNFKFHRSVKIDGNGTVTVWSSDTGVTHEPPQTIVMKQQKWFVSDTMKTALLNSDGEEVAASERVKTQISSFASRHREGLLPENGNGNTSGTSVGVCLHRHLLINFESKMLIIIRFLHIIFVSAAPLLIVLVKTTKQTYESKTLMKMGIHHTIKWLYLTNLIRKYYQL